MEYLKKNPKIFVLTGKAESGKNKVASIIEEYYNNKNIKSVSIAYASYLKEYARKIIGWDGNEETKPRDFLQNIGVDLIKKKIDDKFLINRIKQDILVYSYFCDVIIVTDARFVDEIDAIKEVYSNVLVLNIIRGKNSLTSVQKNHITETALDDYNNYDYVIKNDNLDELRLEINKILEVV